MAEINEKVWRTYKTLRSAKNCVERDAEWATGEDFAPDLYSVTRGINTPWVRVSTTTLSVRKNAEGMFDVVWTTRWV